MLKQLRKILCTIVVLIALSSFSELIAQNKTITGTVTSSENKQPVAGASVTVKGTKNGTTTDADGKYKITVDSKATTLVFSSASFISYEIRINNQTTINTELIAEVKALDDVVVVGYSTVKRKDLTGSVSSVGSKQLKDFPLSSAAEALQGKLAGVQLISSEGAPGAEILVRVADQLRKTIHLYILLMVYRWRMRCL
jgi:TonB-dependent starch-binding outer membrane protein SusC